MQALLHKLAADFPAISFRPGEKSSWSPDDKVIVYKPQRANEDPEIWSLLHEVGHATLDHTSYTTDLELLKLEAAAWQKAQELATKYGYSIDNDHIQNCLDTYRDWLHRRSTCPACGNTSLQENSRQYSCFNCATKWSVSTSRFCRPYRRVASHRSLASSQKEVVPIKNAFL